GGLPQGHGPDAPGDPRGRVHPLADPVLHGAAGRGDGTAVGDRHERVVLPRRRPRPGAGVPVLRMAAHGSARRAVRDGGLPLLDRVPDGAVRLPAGRPLAAALHAALTGDGTAADRVILPTVRRGYCSSV